MKNVTITLDDALAVRPRVEAAGRGKSLSKFVGELIEREIGRDDEVDLKTIKQFLFGPSRGPARTGAGERRFMPSEKISCFVVRNDHIESVPARPLPPAILSELSPWVSNAASSACRMSANRRSSTR
jgi:hypothetical protein